MKMFLFCGCVCALALAAIYHYIEERDDYHMVATFFRYYEAQNAEAIHN